MSNPGNGSPKSIGDSNRIVLSIITHASDEAAKAILNIYGTNVLDEINQTAWNECGCNLDVQAEKFGNPVKEKYEVIAFPDGSFECRLIFIVHPSDPDFVRNVLAEYMDGFDDWIRVVQNGYYGRTGERKGGDIKLLDWEVKIEKVGETPERPPQE